MKDRNVCPLCGYSALRLEPPTYEPGHEGETARPTWSRFHGRRFCIRCHEWVVPEFRIDYQRRYGLNRPVEAGA